LKTPASPVEGGDVPPPSIRHTERRANDMEKIGADVQLPTRVPEGVLCYAIGDVHGRADLFTALVRTLRADSAHWRAETGKKPLLVLLGDYVDRGPDSKLVIQTAIDLQRGTDFEVVALRGNHDQYLIDFLADGTEASDWLDYGGATTLLSYGLRPPSTRTDREAWRDAGVELATLMPPDHIEFLRETRLSATVGDYVFVHAGVRPGRSLAEQDQEDLLSIRRTFLKSDDPLPGKAVVFGHTPFERVFLRPGKIGIDTGAYATNLLTAARFRDDRVRFIQAA